MYTLQTLTFATDIRLGSDRSHSKGLFEIFPTMYDKSVFGHSPGPQLIFEPSTAHNFFNIAQNQILRKAKPPWIFLLYNKGTTSFMGDVLRGDDYVKPYALLGDFLIELDCCSVKCFVSL